MIDMIHDKKGQLRWMEFKYFFIGFILGVIVGFIVAWLLSQGRLKLPWI